jgi:protein-tyrosine phosphatase
MIDIHTHLLPGVDDGSPSIEVSIEVLRRFGTEGVNTLVCTPHLRASQASKAPQRAYDEIFQSLRSAAPPIPALRRGWEIMLDVPGIDLTSPVLSLGQSSAVLVEFPRTGVPSGAGQELARLRESGVVPVLAHPERYWGCTASQVAQWRRSGTVIQIDAVALLGGGRMGELAISLLESGLGDCLASDNHGDARSLATVREWMTELGAGEHAALLTDVNPGRVLENLPPFPVPPVKLRRTMLDRLRDLVRGRRQSS